MPVAAWMSIEGENQGNISDGAGSQESIGTLTKIGHEDEILVWAWDHAVTQPTDRASGGSSGTRVHSPVTITKQFDKCSPMLYQALCSGEALPSVVVNFFRIEGAAEVQYFTITLENAKVTEVKSWMPNFQDTAKAHLQQMEDVQFRYTKIMWENKKTSTQSEDDWRAEG